MNRKEAKKEALGIVIAMIYQELRSPTGFTYSFDSDEDVKKVNDELKAIHDQLSKKLEKQNS